MDKPDVGPVSYRFIERLTNLTPTQRRLVLATACRRPWRDNPDDLPECYSWDYEYAVAQENDERTGRLQPDPKGSALASFDPESFFSDDRPPVTVEFLNQLKDATPVARATLLLLGANASWFRDNAPELEEERPPEWLKREIDYMTRLSQLEGRALKLAAKHRVDVQEPE